MLLTYNLVSIKQEVSCKLKIVSIATEIYFYFEIGRRKYVKSSKKQRSAQGTVPLS